MVHSSSLLKIVYQDEHCIAIDKPSGLLVHRSRIASDVSQTAMTLLRDQINQWVYPVHRLDRPTSGILLFALSKEGARRFNHAFAQHQVNKTYVALVRGFYPSQLFIDEPLKERLDPLSDAQADLSKAAQDAQTQTRCLDQVELPISVSKYSTSRYSLVEACPLTGRRHQIRRHLAHQAHPIIGDTSHGRTEHNHFFRNHFACTRLLLSAVRLEFIHPFTEEHIKVHASLGDEFLRVAQLLFKKKTLAPFL